MEPSSKERSTHFDAFISYSRTDSGFVRTLQRSLETKYARLPKELRKGKRHLRLCRDETDLTGGADLEPAIVSHIRDSRYLLVICSPASRAASWVNKEIEAYRRSHGVSANEGIVAVLLAGEDPLHETAFPTSLLESGEEPLAVEFRHNKIAPTEKYDRYRRGDGLLRILAPLLDIKYPELKNRHREYEKSRLKRLVLLVSAVALLLAGMLVATVFQYREADRQRRIAFDNLDDAILGYFGLAEIELANGDLDNAEDEYGYALKLAEAIPPDSGPELAALWSTFSDHFLSLGDELSRAREFGRAQLAYVVAGGIAVRLLTVAEANAHNEEWEPLLTGRVQELGKRLGLVQTIQPADGRANTVDRWRARIDQAEQAIEAVSSGRGLRSDRNGFYDVRTPDGEIHAVSVGDGAPLPFESEHVRFRGFGVIRDGSASLLWVMTAVLRDEGDFTVSVSTSLDETLSATFECTGPGDVTSTFWPLHEQPGSWLWLQRPGSSWISFEFLFQDKASGKSFEAVQWVKFDARSKTELWSRGVPAPPPLARRPTTRLIRNNQCRRLRA